MQIAHSSYTYIALHKTKKCTIFKSSEALGAQLTNVKGNREMNIRKSYENWREYRKTVNELNALSTRELSDLGINRHDIRAIARSSQL